MPEHRTVQTMCPMNCHPTLCGMKAEVADDALVSITGDPDNPDSAGFLCMRGNAAHQIVGNPERLLTPLIRTGPGAENWRKAGWDEALDLIADRMRDVGPKAVGFWQGHGNAANDYGVGVKRRQTERFTNLYGCQHWDPAMICWGLGGFGLGLTGALETSTKEDMGAQSDMVVLWGANTVSQANTIKHVEKAKRRGARIVVIDVRRTEASALADKVLLVKPGSDTALALAMMHVIVQDGLVDQAFVAAHTLGYDDLVPHLDQYTPDWAAQRTGLSPDQITAFARAYAQTRPAMIVMGGSSLHKGDNTWQAARAISCLPALTGNYGRTGGGIGPRHGARSHGAGFADISAPDRRPPGPYVPNQIEAIAEALETRQVQVMMALGSNMLSSFPDTNRLREALADDAVLVVSYDIFMNQTAREVADVILPGTIWLEEIGAKATNTHVYLSDLALAPAGETKPLYDVYRGLATRLGIADVYPWPNQEAAIDAVLDHPATGHATVADMRKNGGRAALNISHVAYPTFDFDTPSGKVELLSARAESMGLDALPSCASDTDTALPLAFAHGRTFAHFHSFYDHARALPALAAREPAPQLWLAPADAAARQIADGDAIVLTSQHGSFPALAKVTRRMPQGAVWMHDGWAGLNALMDGASVLPEAALTAFAFSVGQPHFGAHVEVARA